MVYLAENDDDDCDCDDKNRTRIIFKKAGQHLWLRIDTRYYFGKDVDSELADMLVLI